MVDSSVPSTLKVDGFLLPHLFLCSTEGNSEKVLKLLRIALLLVYNSILDKTCNSISIQKN